MSSKCIISAKVSDTVWLFLMPMVRLLEKNGYEVIVTCGDGLHADDLKEAGVAHVPFEFKVTYNPFAALKQAWGFRRVLRDNEASVLICNDPWASFVSRIATAGLGIKNRVYYCHGLPFVRGTFALKNLLYEACEIIALFFTDIVITMNCSDYAYMKALDRACYKVNGVGVDTGSLDRVMDMTRTQARKLFDLPEGVRLVCYIGRLIKEKGILDFIAAARDAKPGVMYVVAGAGALEDQVRKAEQEGHLIYVGYTDKVPELLRAIDLLVLPTYYNEGLPRVIMEAMTVGVPVIAARTRGCIDLVTDGVDGIVIEPKSHEQIKSAVSRLLLDQGLYDKLRHAARSNIEENYDVSFVLKQLEAIFKGAGIFTNG